VAESNTSKILWRGVMAGLLGNIVKFAIFWFYYGFINTEESGYLSKSDMLEVSVVLGIPSGVSLSIIIVAIIRWIKFKSGRSIGILGGAAIGVVFMGALLGLLWLLSNTPVSPNVLSFIIIAPFMCDYGVIIGAVAGMMAWQRDSMRLP
jgi:hypothetical protein